VRYLSLVFYASMGHSLVVISNYLHEDTGTTSIMQQERQIPAMDINLSKNLHCQGCLQIDEPRFKFKFQVGNRLELCKCKNHLHGKPLYK